jgi:hypothetical protein
MFATSYIPTTVSAVTRLRDDLTFPLGSNVSQNEFTVVYQYERVNGGQDDGAGSGPVQIGSYYTDASMTIGGYGFNDVNVLAVFGGPPETLIKGYAPVQYGVTYKMAFRLEPDKKSVYHARNGAMDPAGAGVSSNAKSANWAGTIGRIGQSPMVNTAFHIKHVVFFSKALSNAEMQAATAA